VGRQIRQCLLHTCTSMSSQAQRRRPQATAAQQPIRHRHGSLVSCSGHGALAPPYPRGGQTTSVSGAPANGCRDENFTSPPKTGAGIGARLEKSFLARHLFSWTGPHFGPSAGVALRASPVRARIHAPIRF
jgi:hypothetical protein